MSKFASLLLFSSLAAVIVGTPSRAQSATQDELIATIQALQKRVAALEAQSRKGDKGSPLTAPRRMRKTVDAPVITGPSTISGSGQAAARSLQSFSSFDGFYGAIFGGYQSGLEGKRESSPLINSLTAPEFSTFGSSKVGGSIGYNRVLGDILIGVEGRVFTNVGAARGGGLLGTLPENMPTFPRLVFSGCCNINPSFISPPSDTVLSNTIRTQTKLERGVGGDASIRLGFVLGDTLLYGRFGAGAQEVSASYRYDATGVVTCVSPMYQDQIGQFGQFSRFITGCSSFRNEGAFVRSRAATAPFVLAGGGIEQNFGSLFVRLEGSLNAMLAPSIQGIKGREVFLTPEAIGAVGYRF